jgi:hypothetical protein
VNSCGLLHGSSNSRLPNRCTVVPWSFSGYTGFTFHQQGEAMSLRFALVSLAFLLVVSATAKEKTRPYFQLKF